MNTNEMTPLDRVIQAERNEYHECDLKVWGITVEEAAAELAQLRADLQAAQERIAEQARQLDAARELRKLAEELVNSLGYWLSLDQEPQECVKAELALGAWLAANPAPSAEPQP